MVELEYIGKPICIYIYIYDVLVSKQFCLKKILPRNNNNK